MPPGSFQPKIQIPKLSHKGLQHLSLIYYPCTISFLPSIPCISATLRSLNNWATFCHHHFHLLPLCRCVSLHLWRPSPPSSARELPLILQSQIKCHLLRGTFHDLGALPCSPGTCGLSSITVYMAPSINRLQAPWGWKLILLGYLCSVHSIEPRL